MWGGRQTFSGGKTGLPREGGLSRFAAMSGKEEPIQVVGAVIEVLPGTTFRVELPNGHVVLAHIPGKGQKDSSGISVGDRVRVEMSSYDLTKARILVSN